MVTLCESNPNCSIYPDYNVLVELLTIFEYPRFCDSLKGQKYGLSLVWSIIQATLLGYDKNGNEYIHKTYRNTFKQIIEYTYKYMETCIAI